VPKGYPFYFPIFPPKNPLSQNLSSLHTIAKRYAQLNKNKESCHYSATRVSIGKSEVDIIFSSTLPTIDMEFLNGQESSLIPDPHVASPLLPDPLTPNQQKEETALYTPGEEPIALVRSSDLDRSTTLIPVVNLQAHHESLGGSPFSGDRLDLSIYPCRDRGDDRFWKHLSSKSLGEEPVAGAIETPIALARSQAIENIGNFFIRSLFY
jgi:hypothetical protein